MPNNAKVTLIGNLVSEPKQRKVGANDVTAICVACNTSVKKDDGTYDSNFYDVSIWGKHGEYIMQAAQKGTQVWVTGDLILRTYKDKEGNDRHSLTVSATDVRCLQRTKSSGGSSYTPRQNNTRSNENDDMPF